MHITKSNELIVNFLGWHKVNYINDIIYYYIPDGFELIKEVETTIESNWCEILQEQDTCKLEEMKFLVSWDWIIPVINKINDMHDQRTYILVGHIFEEIKNNLYNTDIKELYKNVIEFINCFNSDKEDFFIEYK